MSQHDYSIDNQTFPATRTDINNALAAILSNNSGTSYPSTTVAGMWCFRSDDGWMYQRNAADSGWIKKFKLADVALIPQNGSTNYAADGGSNDSYAITLDPAPASYTTGMVVQFKANTANTGAATLNVNSLGAKTIKKNYNDDLSDNDIKANQMVQVIYDGTNFQLLSPISNTVSTPVSDEFLPADQTITPGGTLTLGHSFGAQPKKTFFYLVCQTAEGGYAVGDVVDPVYIGDSSAATAGGACTIWYDDTSNVKVQFGNQAPIINKRSSTAGTQLQITAANWKARFRAWK